ncbi:hypothetical protein C7R92_23920 [Brevibacillus porteri]|uniref:Uncharacterized protein n=2 Tax=Brevibacillus porteri TaxID=2126350 RepID=A0ABX5FJK8_9BACL|nr:hypothetical protein C7R92_23920 [Brevibacillus porteri]
MIEPIKQIMNHIEELDNSIAAIKRKGNGRDHVTWESYGQLMQAKSTGLLALAQIEANTMLNRPIIIQDLKVEDIIT